MELTPGQIKPILRVKELVESGKMDTEQARTAVQNVVGQPGAPHIGTTVPSLPSDAPKQPDIIPLKDAVRTEAAKMMGKHVFGSPLGPSDSTLDKLGLKVETGPLKYLSYLNRGTVKTTGAGLDLVMRAFTAAPIIGAGIIADAFEKTGGDSQEAVRLFRDLNGLFAMAEIAVAGKGANFNPTGYRKLRDAKIDGLVKEGKITSADAKGMKEKANIAEDYVHEQMGTKKLSTQEIIGPNKTPLFHPQAKLNPQVVKKVERMFEDAGEARDPSMSMTEQIIDYMSRKAPIRQTNGRLADSDDLAGDLDIDSILAQNNLSLKELLGLMQSETTAAARLLGGRGGLSKRLKALEKEMEGTGQGAVDASTEFANIIKGQASATKKYHSLLRRADNVRRGIMVSLPMTASRNFMVGLGRVGLDALEDGFNIGLSKMFGRGKPDATPASEFAGTFRALMRPGSGPRAQKHVEYILDTFPEVREELFLRFSADVFGKGGKMEEAVTTLNGLNRLQDFVLRRAKFGAEIQKKLVARGSSLEKWTKDNDLSILSQDDVTDAMQKALEFTFARNPKSSIVKDAVSAVNKLPFLATAALPYPRFLANSTNFIFDHSLGIARVMTKEGRARMAKGDFSQIGKPLAGAMTFYAAKRTYDEYHKDTDPWYAVRLNGPDQPASDIRGFQPFASMYFVADIMHRKETGNFTSKDITEWGEALIGFGGRGLETHVAPVDSFIKAFSGDSKYPKERVMRDVSKFVANLAGNYLTPAQAISDLLLDVESSVSVPADITQRALGGGPSKESTQRDTTQVSGPIDLSKAVNKVPILKQGLPEKEVVTREAAPVRQNTSFRQLFGITTLEESNQTEKALFEVDLKPHKVFKLTGFPEVDTAMKKHAGRLVEKTIEPVVSTDGYKNKGFEEKRIILSKLFSSVRSASFALAAREIKNQPGGAKRIREIIISNTLSDPLERILKREVK